MVKVTCCYLVPQDSIVGSKQAPDLHQANKVKRNMAYCWWIQLFVFMWSTKKDMNFRVLWCPTLSGCRLIFPIQLFHFLLSDLLMGVILKRVCHIKLYILRNLKEVSSWFCTVGLFLSIKASLLTSWVITLAHCLFSILLNVSENCLVEDIFSHSMLQLLYNLHSKFVLQHMCPWAIIPACFAMAYLFQRHCPFGLLYRSQGSWTVQGNCQGSQFSFEAQGD